MRMAQSDYNLFNEGVSSAIVLQNIDDAFLALCSMNSGADFPTQRLETGMDFLLTPPGSTLLTAYKYFGPAAEWVALWSIDIATGEIAATGGIGTGQRWQNMLSPTVLRVGNTSYQNTTTRPIMVVVRSSVAGGGINLQVSANNTTWITVGVNGGTDAINQYAIVPVGHFYRWTSTSIQNWAELR